MNINDLIEQLEIIRDNHGDDVEVQLAVQPSWPLAHTIANVVVVDPDYDDDTDEATVWIAASDGHPARGPYAPKAAWEGY